MVYSRQFAIGSRQPWFQLAVSNSQFAVGGPNSKYLIPNPNSRVLTTSPSCLGYSSYKQEERYMLAVGILQ